MAAGRPTSDLAERFGIRVEDLDTWLRAHRVETRESRACTIRDTDINWELAPSPWPSSSTPADDQPTGDGSPTHSPSWRAARPTRSGESRSSNRSAMRIDNSQQAIHALHDLQRRHDQQHDRYLRLLDDVRALRRHRGRAA